MTRPPIRAKRGANLGGASAHNRRVVIDALRINGRLSRAELARATGLTGQTMSNIVAELEADGLVAADGPVRIGRGQPATPYRLLANGAFAIGVQIDRHVTRTVAVDLLGQGLVKCEAALPPGGPETGLPVVLGLVKETRRRLAALDPSSERRLVGLGVAMPGPFGIRSLAEDAWMMTAWHEHPLRQALAAGTGLEVTIQNDAAAAATAERLSGAGGGLDHFVYLYFGYGLGAGLVINGEIYTGGHRNAGEIGMALPLSPDGGVGERLEHIVSLAGLCRTLGTDPADPALPVLIERGIDSAPLQLWLDRAAPRLAWAVQMLETVFDPQTIVLGGSGPAVLVDALWQRMLPLPAAGVPRPDGALPRLVLGRVDPFMVALGAAAEPISRAFDPRFAAVQKAADPA